MQKDLDLELNRKRSRSISSMSLDYVNTMIVDKTNMKSAIYDMIDMELQGMRTEGTYHYKEFETIPFKTETLKGRCKRFLKKVDRSFQRSSFYRLKMRESLKKLYNYFNPAMSINMLKVLKLNDEKLVIKLYQEIFCRNPEPEGIEHNVDVLKNGKLNKYDLFMFMYKSGDNTAHKRLKWKQIARLIYKR